MRKKRMEIMIQILVIIQIKKQVKQKIKKSILQVQADHLPQVFVVFFCDYCFSNFCFTLLEKKTKKKVRSPSRSTSRSRSRSNDSYDDKKNKKNNGRGRSYSPTSTNSRSTIIKKKAQSIQAKNRDTNLSNYKSTKGTSKFEHHNVPSATGSCPGIHENSIQDLFIY